MCGLAEIGNFSGNEIAVARVAAQCNAGGFLGHSLAVGRRCVEIVDPMFYGIVHQMVDFLLVDDSSAIVCFLPFEERQSHHPESEKRHLVSCIRIGPECHFSRLFRSGCILWFPGACRQSRNCSSGHRHCLEKISP